MDPYKILDTDPCVQYSCVPEARPILIIAHDAFQICVVLP